MFRTLTSIAALFIFWLLCSAEATHHFADPLLLSFGIGTCMLVVWIGRRMDIVDHEGHPAELGWRFLLYFPWLLWEIIKANIDVAKRVLSPSLPIDPAMLPVKASQKTDLGKVIYANSITLTPGTVTIAIDGDTFMVHAIARELIDDSDTNEMNRRVTALERHN